MSEKEYIHIRIRSPERYDKDSFRVITFGKGIKATIGCPEGQFKEGECQVGTEVQKLLFPKDKFTKEKVRAWIRKHRQTIKVKKIKKKK